jgi:hypothetical protein
LHVDVVAELESLGFPLAATTIATVLTRVRRAIEHPGTHQPGSVLPRELSEAPHLRPFIDTITRRLPELGPEGMAAREVAACLARLSDWAEENGALTTAVALAEAAFDCSPGAGYAYDIGRLARRMGKEKEAETWWRYTAQAFPEPEHQESVVLALLGLADLSAEREVGVEGTLRTLARARALARRARLRLLEGDTHYAAALRLLEAGRLEEGTEAAGRALEVYGDEHGRVYDLAFDVAWILMERYGEFQTAADLFHGLLRWSEWEGRLILVYACLARAAAALGQEQLYEVAYATTWTFLTQQQGSWVTRPALIQLALASASFDFWGRAEVTADYLLGASPRDRDDVWQRKAREIVHAATQEGSVPLEVMERVFPDSRFPDAEARPPHSAAVGLGLALLDLMQPRADGGPTGPIRRLGGSRSRPPLTPWCSGPFYGSSTGDSRP